MNREALPQTRQRHWPESRLTVGGRLPEATVGAAACFPSLAMMAGAGIEREP